MKTVLFLAILTLSTRLCVAAEAVPSGRLPYGGSWNGIVGVRDVDPTTRTQYSVSVPNGGDGTGKMATTATVSQLNAAIAAAGANQYVELASGVFTVGGDLVFNTNNKTLRGQVNANGVPTTTLRFSSGNDHVLMFTTVWDFGSSGDFTTRTVSSGLSRSSTTVTLTAAPTGLTAGRLMWFSTNESSPDIDGGGGWTDFMGTKAFCFVVKVTAVSGNDVTFTPAINPDYLTGLTVEVSYRTAGSQLDYCGLENVILEVGTSGNFDSSAILLQGTNQCWIKNCQLLRIGNVTSLNALVYIYGAYGLEISHSKFAGTSAPGSSAVYSMASFDSSGLLIVNNEFTQTSNVYPILMTSGSVFAYNYCHKMDYGAFQSQWVFDHGGADHFNLMEGNWIAGGHIMDGPTNGGNPSHSNSTLIVRERIEGYDAAGGATTNLNCLLYLNQGSHRNVTVAACVLGTSGIQDGYNGGGGGTTGEGEGYIFNVPSGTDATLLRLGNYNTFNAAIPAAETAALGGNTVATSYVYTAKPSWFGNRPWPWVDPASPSQSNTATNLPAGYRAANGTDPPADGGGGAAIGTLNVTNLNITGP